MTSRREVLRFASLATAAGCAPVLTRGAFAAQRTTSQSLLGNHRYHAEATVLRSSLGSTTAPLPSQAFVSLSSSGGYRSLSAGGFDHGSSVSFSSGYSEVSGQSEAGPGRGWITSSTAVVEGLNIADVVTADRIVSRISTVHSHEGYVPSVSFAGSRFENLRVAGHLVELNLDLSMLGEKPAGDVPYISHPEFRQRVQVQQGRLTARASGAIASRYAAAPSESGDGDQIEFSLIHGVGGGLGVRSYGNVIHVPGFGDVLLGMVRLSQKDYLRGTARATTIELTMVQSQPNPADGSGNGGSGSGGGGGVSSPVSKTNGDKGP